MKILHVAKHGKGCNDNEGAIGYALKQLGHRVKSISEATYDLDIDYKQQGYDLLLFQNWKNPPNLGRITVPHKVFWYMDRIDYGTDRILERWTTARMHWMRKVIPDITLGVCTDGDWVARDKTKKLIHLMQGCDTRVAKMPFRPGTNYPMLFTGSIYGRGEGRASWLKEMKQHYGSNFLFKTELYGSDLIDTVHNTSIVLAPDGPVSDKYWSNRVYVMLSFGAFLMHPYCSLLAEQYKDGEEIVYYHSREEMHDKIGYYLQRPQERWRIQQAGFQRTMDEHTYKHRLQVILTELEKRTS
jgi:hypothetical protein